MTRLLIEASAAYGQHAGIGRYARNVIARLVPALPGHEVTLFRTRERDAGWTPPSGVREAVYPLTRRRFEQAHLRLGLPLPMRPLTGAADRLYSPDFSGPALRDVPRVVTIHDLAFLTHPQLLAPGARAYLTGLVERERRRGATMVAVSRTTQRRMVDLLGLREEDVPIVGNGVDRRFLDAAAPDAVTRARLGLPNAYLLMVGTIEPRKNHAAVLRVLARHAGLPLVLVGRMGWGSGQLMPEIARLRTSGRIVWLEGLVDADLPSTYAGATGVLVPSWTEGFGLPVIEALAAGVPVLTGDDPVFGEVAGDLALRVDPADDAAIAAGIAALEAGLAPGDAATRRAHAARYDWDDAIRPLIELLGRDAGSAP